MANVHDQHADEFPKAVRAVYDAPSVGFRTHCVPRLLNTLGRSAHYMPFATLWHNLPLPADFIDTCDRRTENRRLSRLHQAHAVRAGAAPPPRKSVDDWFASSRRRCGADMSYDGDPRCIDH